MPSIIIGSRMIEAIHLPQKFPTTQHDSVSFLQQQNDCDPLSFDVNDSILTSSGRELPPLFPNRYSSPHDSLFPVIITPTPVLPQDERDRPPADVSGGGPSSMEMRSVCKSSSVLYLACREPCSSVTIDGGAGVTVTTTGTTSAPAPAHPVPYAFSKSSRRWVRRQAWRAWERLWRVG